MTPTEHPKPAQPRPSGRRVLRGANFTVYTLVVLAIVVLCNWFVNRNDHHLDLTPNHSFSLSPQSLKILRGLKEPVTIYVFNNASGFQSERDLMNLYSSASHAVSVKYIDPDRDPGLARQFGVRSEGDVYVTEGRRHLKASAATEEGITNALIRMLKGQKVIYFVEGHGERNTDGLGREGYSQFKQALDNEDSAVKTLTLVQNLKIPADCSILAIAGPKTDYLPPEIAAIKKYLDGGGRLWVFLDPGVNLPNLDGLLKNYGVTVNNDLVIDENPVSQIFGTSPTMPIIISYGDNPIVQALSRRMTLFPLSRSFQVASNAPPGVTLDSLCNTSQASFGVANFNTNMREVSYRPGVDTKGPLVVAAAGQLTGTGSGQGGRFVVVGTSLVAANAYLGFQSNRDLVLNMAEWLTSNEGLISIRPKPSLFQHLNLTTAQMGGFLIRVMLIPVCIVIIGIVVWWSRR